MTWWGWLLFAVMLAPFVLILAAIIFTGERPHSNSLWR